MTKSTMAMTFRWFGPDDPVRLEHIRQIPGVDGIVTALHDVPPGEAWRHDDVAARRDAVGAAGLRIAVIESIPVHEDIKRGLPSRDRLTDHFCESLVAVGAAGIPVVCYNWMPIFDWMRTDVAFTLADGSTALAYDDRVARAMDLTIGIEQRPAWASAYDGATLALLLDAYRQMEPERLWEHLAWFLERVVPVAEEAGVRMALHPDDPPWPIFGVPRIITDAAALARVTSLVDRQANGITFCTGSLGARADNDLPAMIRALGPRIHFMHCRNVLRTAQRDFHEVPHPSRFGSVDMLAVMQALVSTGFTGPMRPDHGRMIWGETGRGGYGLHDRALGAMYLQGLWEAASRGR